MSRRRLAVLHGPNLNLLGRREPEIYGHTTLGEIDEGLRSHAKACGFELDCSQHSGEGAMVDAIHAALDAGCEGILINPGAYTHTSIAIRDALVGVGLPAVEVHLSNVYAREPFRHHSTIADIVRARVMGFGATGYRLALDGLIAALD